MAQLMRLSHGYTRKNITMQAKLSEFITPTNEVNNSKLVLT